MLFWILIIIILIGQETVSTSWIMTKAYQQNHFNLLFLSLIFLTTSILEILLCSKFGIFIKTNKKLNNKIKNSKLVSLIKRNRVMTKMINHVQCIINKENSLVGIKEKKIFLIYLSATVFPVWFNALISPWLNLKINQIFFPVFIGAIFWYLCILLVVVGVSYIVKDAKIAMIIILGLSLVYVILQKDLTKKQNKN